MPDNRPIVTITEMGFSSKFLGLMATLPSIQTLHSEYSFGRVGSKTRGGQGSGGFSSVCCKATLTALRTFVMVLAVTRGGYLTAGQGRPRRGGVSSGISTSELAGTKSPG